MLKDKVQGALREDYIQQLHHGGMVQFLKKKVGNFGKKMQINLSASSWKYSEKVYISRDGGRGEENLATLQT